MQKRIILILPCYNEAESLPHTLKQLEIVQADLKKRYRFDILFVNDGSSDSTQEILEKAARKNNQLFFREFAHNAGHQSALRAGINAAVSYDAAVMMDADLQHPPELIPSMIKCWEDGAKVVQMIRKDKGDVGSLKFFIRRTYYRFINTISNLNLEYGASDFRLIDNSVIKTVAQSPERDLFLRGYFSWLPVARVALEYKPNKRIAGSSKYDFRRLRQLTYNSILQFSEKPLRISVALGVIMAVLSFLYGSVLAILHIMGLQSVSGWTSLMVVMLFCFGLNFILIGVIGHYLGHAISLLKQRPEFIIAKEKVPND